MSTLVLNLDDRLERKLALLAARSCQPLPDWAADQLRRLASPDATDAASAYSDEWKALFDADDDPSFVAPARSL